MRSLVLASIALALIACEGKSLATRGKPVLELQSQQFVTALTGKFVESMHGEAYTFFADGTVVNLSVRQVGGGEGNPVPYPTACSYIRTGNVISIKERSIEERDRYMDYATHEVEIEYNQISLTNELQKDTSENPRCGIFLQDRLARMQNGKTMAYTIYAEIFDGNSFRTHTSGGGGQVKGEPRNEGTLDEVFTRVQP